MIRPTSDPLLYGQWFGPLPALSPPPTGPPRAAPPRRRRRRRARPTWIPAPSLAPAGGARSG